MAQHCYLFIYGAPAFSAEVARQGPLTVLTATGDPPTYLLSRHVACFSFTSTHDAAYLNKILAALMLMAGGALAGWELMNPSIALARLRADSVKS